ncbi:sporulation protein YunB [Alkalihalophilus pseudofirmus]|nr:sporulation protein YunB [Alkalihalophilus pseudofirmus]
MLLIKLNKKKPISIRSILLVSFVLFILLTIQALYIVERGIRPTIINVAVTETQRIAAQSINDAIDKKIVEHLDMDQLLKIDYKKDGEISSVRFNPQIYNRVTAEATTRVQRSLQFVNTESFSGFFDDIENDPGIIHHIPLGIATNNSLLANFGPLIPVKFTTIGDVQSEVRAKVVSAGVNNTHVSVYITIIANVKVVIPFATETTTVENNILLSDIFIPGEIPEWYGGDTKSGLIPISKYHH